MTFDPKAFEAQVALGLLPTEQFPGAAQDALEAGFDGRALLRLAILEKPSGWEVDQLLPKVLAELGRTSINKRETAERLARSYAEQLLSSGEDPLSRLSYFHSLYIASEYHADLAELAYIEDDFWFTDSEEEKREITNRALEELLSPELREMRRAEREALWQGQREDGRRREEEARKDWPYVFHSARGKGMLRNRYRQQVAHIRPLLLLQPVTWLLLGWSLGLWRTAVAGALLSIPFTLALSYWGVYRQLRQEQRTAWLRLNYSKD